MTDYGSSHRAVFPCELTGEARLLGKDGPSENTQVRGELPAKAPTRRVGKLWQTPKECNREIVPKPERFVV